MAQNHNWLTTIGGIIYFLGTTFQHSPNQYIAWLAQGGILFGPLLIGLAANYGKGTPAVVVNNNQPTVPVIVPVKPEAPSSPIITPASK